MNKKSSALFLTLFLSLISASVSATSTPLFSDNFDDSSLNAAWTTSGDVSEHDGELDIHTPGDCNYDRAYVNLNTLEGDLNVNFDWRTEVSGWYENPTWRVQVDGSTVYSETLDRGYNEVNSGSRNETMNVSGSVKLEFFIEPSGACGAGDHYYTDLYVDALTTSLTPESSKPQISQPSPDQINKDSSSDVSLSVHVEDNESDTMNLTFYNASDNSQIGQILNKQNGTYSTTWSNLPADTTQTWYVNVTDGTSTVQSPTYSFTTLDIDLSWTDNSNNEDGFRIENNASGSFQPVGDVSKDTTNYIDSSSDLAFGRYTCYRVKSYNQFGESSPLEGCITP